MPSSRRGLLKLGLTGTAVLVLGGGLASRWSAGLQPDGRLTPEARAALGAIGRVVLDGSLAEGEQALQQQLDGFEAVIAKFPPAVRAELGLLLSLLANGAGRLLLLRSAHAPQDLPRAELQALLEAMRQSALPLRQQAYFALRDLHCAAFFAEPANWAAIGYPGPLALS